MDRESKVVTEGFINRILHKSVLNQKPVPYGWIYLVLLFGKSALLHLAIISLLIIDIYFLIKGGQSKSI